MLLINAFKLDLSIFIVFIYDTNSIFTIKIYEY